MEMIDIITVASSAIPIIFMLWAVYERVHRYKLETENDKLKYERDYFKERFEEEVGYNVLLRYGEEAYNQYKEAINRLKGETWIK